ncbi:MAG: exodeoxyribonuclease VII large subunit, partial [Chloroflexota bacterium]
MYFGFAMLTAFLIQSILSAMSQISLFQQPESPYTVGEITTHIRDLMEGDQVLQDLWVQGEVSNFSSPKSGHLYFTIKDAKAALRCVMWKNSAARLVYRPQEGDSIEVHGNISVYEVSGQYQLYADQIRTAGEGALYQEFLRLKEKLEGEGLFDESHKKELPIRPKIIGIVSSPSGAALHDMINTIRRRFSLAQVVLAPATVQGDAAPDEIIQAIDNLTNQVKPDVILLARGGGSIEDLWAFNDEGVVRAVAASEIPVISGIGHETDFTLTDFAADLRAPTPTAAA